MQILGQNEIWLALNTVGQFVFLIIKDRGPISIIRKNAPLRLLNMNNFRKMLKYYLRGQQRKRNYKIICYYKRNAALSCMNYVVRISNLRE